MNENSLVLVSMNIPKNLYERIKREKLRYRDLIESAIHYKDMDVRQVKELLERIEKMSRIIENTNKRVWELEGKFIDEIKKNGGN